MGLRLTLQSACGTERAQSCQYNDGDCPSVMRHSLRMGGRRHAAVLTLSNMRASTGGRAREIANDGIVTDSAAPHRTSRQRRGISREHVAGVRVGARTRREQYRIRRAIDERQGTGRHPRRRPQTRGRPVGKRARHHLGGACEDFGRRIEPLRDSDSQIPLRLRSNRPSRRLRAGTALPLLWRSSARVCGALAANSC